MFSQKSMEMLRDSVLQTQRRALERSVFDSYEIPVNINTPIVTMRIDTDLGSGYFSGVITRKESVDPEVWEDYGTYQVKASNLADILTIGKRYPCRPAHTDASGDPIYEAYSGDSSDSLPPGSIQNFTSVTHNYNGSSVNYDAGTTINWSGTSFNFLASVLWAISTGQTLNIRGGDLVLATATEVCGPMQWCVFDYTVAGTPINDLVLPVDANGLSRVVLRFIGAGGTFELNSIIPHRDNQILLLVNATGELMKVNHNGGGTANYRFNTPRNVTMDIEVDGAALIYYDAKTTGSGKGWRIACCGPSPLTTKGDIYTRDAIKDARLPVGANGYILSANSAQSTGLEWITPPSASIGPGTPDYLTKWDGTGTNIEDSIIYQTGTSEITVLGLLSTADHHLQDVFFQPHTGVDAGRSANAWYFHVETAIGFAHPIMHLSYNGNDQITVDAQGTGGSNGVLFTVGIAGMGTASSISLLGASSNYLCQGQAGLTGTLAPGAAATGGIITSLGSGVYVTTADIGVSVQPYDADLASIATLTTDSFGRGLLELISGAAVRSYIGAGTGSGTVTTVSVVTANGISGTVANAATTPTITLVLGAIVPTSVNGVVFSGSSTPTLAVSGTSSISGTHSGTSSGTNTGDQTTIVGITGTLAQFNTACTDADFARTDAANTFTGHQTIEGVTSTGATGTNKFVFDTSPTLVTPTLGVAVATSINKITITAPATGATLTIDDGLTIHVTGNVTALSGSHTGTSSGTNTGDQTSVSGNAGTATALQTARAIYGNNFDGTAALSQIIASTYGGTGNGFTKFTGPATSEKTFTLPNVSSVILTDNAAVTVAQGGTGRATSTTAYGLIAAGTTATGAHQTLAAGATTDILVGGGSSALPVWTAASGSGAPLRQTSPVLVTPDIGVPSAGNLTNCTGFPGASSSEIVLGSTFALNTTSGTYQDLGISVSLGVGTHEIKCQIRGQMKWSTGTLGYITARLYNVTTTAAVSDSEAIVVMTWVPNVESQNTAFLVAKVTVAVPTVIRLEAFRAGATAYTTSAVPSDTDGKTKMVAVKLS